MTLGAWLDRRRLLAAGLVMILLSLPACGRGGDAKLVLDGRPRFPTASGVIEAIEGRTIRLRNGRTYTATDDFRSFSTYTLALEPMRNRVGEYVQLGVHGSEAHWMAGIGALLTEDPPRVVYSGRLIRVDDRRRAVFRDGTVFALAQGVVPPKPGDAVLQVEIDAVRNEVVSLTPA